VSNTVVGLDMSLTGSGICVVQNDVSTIETLKTGPHDFSCDLERLLYITNTVMSKIPQTPSLICIEDYFIPMSTAQTGAAMSLNSLGTLMRIKMYEAKFPFIIISPPQLKKFILGKGVGQKSLIMKEVFKKYNVDVKDDNQADAFVLAQIALAIEDMAAKANLSKYTKPQVDVITTIMKDRPLYNRTF